MSISKGRVAVFVLAMFLLSLSHAHGQSSSATFLQADTTTQGNWHGTYGADGYSVSGDSQNTPSYATFTIQDGQGYTWDASTTDVRALQTADGSTRIASAWYDTTTFSFDINLIDGNTHQVALYLLDWDNSGRSETIQVLDAVTQTVLDTRSISGFTNGEYLVWNISGNVQISVTQTAGPNGVASGVFFGGSSTITSTAGFVRADTSTQGNWHGAYGADGYSVVGDSQNIPAYAAFAAQNQATWVWDEISTDPRALQTGSGSARIAATWYNSPEFNLDVNFTDGNSHQFALYAIDWDSEGRTETVQVLDAATEAVLDTRNISGFANGEYLVWNLSGHVRINVIQTGGSDAVVSGVFFGGSSAIGSTASFLRTDLTTQGNWHGAYGADGYSVSGDSQALPSYAAFAVLNQQDYTWDASTTDMRALQTGNGNTRIAAAWYNAPEFNFDVNFTDGNSHQIALYALDWDDSGRAETIQVLDATTETVLDTRSISGFVNGVYLVWTVSGHVHINVIQTDGDNAVISGVFFGGSSTISSTASYVSTDTSTQGNWHGTYGADGYSVVGDTQSIPAYAVFAAQNQATWVWDEISTDPRALQTGSGSARIAATWYNNPEFNLDVNFTDGNPHQLAVYVVDWDALGRAEVVQVLDAATEAVLDTRSVSGFANGQYLVWNISGHVRINVMQTGGINAVVSGVFFGGSSTISSTASFVRADLTTQGSWQGVYGTDGYSISGDSQNIPAYATFSVLNQEDYTWDASTTDVRALQSASVTGRVAATWYNSPEFNFDVNFVDGNSHPFALYAVDWDASGRAETIQVLDAATEAVLDTRSISAFTNGEYLVWNISGHVHINVIQTGSVNAVVSGAFFGQSAGSGSGGGPVITSLLPISGPAGTLVTITGPNFGTSQGSGTVSFNGTLAAVTSWNSTTIIAAVPSNATSGNVVVTAGGASSGGSNFTVTTLNSIAITPATASISTGNTLQFAVMGTYSDGSQQNLSSQAVWSSSVPGVASVSATGVASGVAVGQTTIQATVSSLSASATLGVVGQALTGSLPTAMGGNTLTVLEDTTVLVAGGYDSNGVSLSTVEIYNSGTGTFATTTNLNTARALHTATLLSNGTVLIVGGVANGSALASAEIYNPATGTFTTTGSLNTARSGHTATILPSGQVLIAGGADSNSNSLSSAELYDPTAGTFTLTGSLNTARQGDTATLLGNGMVLLAGGIDANGNTLQSAELYNPATSAFSLTGNMIALRAVFTATLLNNGLVLMTGGLGSSQNSQASAELYNPATGAFAATGSLNSPRSFFTATLLNNGTVLVGGGLDASGNVLGSAELYDPVATTFTFTSSFVTARYTDTAALLYNGNVLEVGGLDSNFNRLASAELYQPSTLTPPGLVCIAITGGGSSSSCGGGGGGSPDPQVGLGASLQLTAVGTFSDNSTQTLVSASWSSSSNTIATVTNDATNQGVAYGVAQGSGTATACTGSICGSTTLTVVPPKVLVSITLNPGNPSIVVYSGLQLSATGVYSDGSTNDVTSSVTWTSSAPSVVSINSAGVAIGLSLGQGVIEASLGSVNSSITVNVVAPPITLVSLAVSSTVPASLVGGTQQFSAVGTYSDGSTQDVTAAVLWTSSNSNVSTVGTSGLATAISAGNTTITASLGDLAISVAFTVSANVAPPGISAAVYPLPNSNGWNDSIVVVTFTCTAGSATIVSCPSPQTVISEGANQTISGTVTDTTGQTASASVTLNIEITPPTITITSPTDQSSVSSPAMTVAGTVSNSLTVVSNVFCNGTTASFASGAFSCEISLNPGANLVMVTASDAAGNLAASRIHVIYSAPLAAPNSLQITPNNVTLLIGNTQQFTAVDDQGRPRSDATWGVSDPAIATLSSNNSPILKGIAAGEVILTATAGSQSAQIQVTISEASFLAPGTIVWSAPPVQGYSTMQTVQAVPSAIGPSQYAIDEGGGAIQVRALSQDGQQKWQNSSIVSPTVSLSNTNGDLELLQPAAGAPFFPGLPGGPTYDIPLIADFDSEVGSQAWQSDFNPNTEASPMGMAVDPDGTVYVTTEGSTNSGTSALYRVDPNSGHATPLAFFPTGTWVIPGGPYQAGYSLPLPALTGPPSVGPDGAVALEYANDNAIASSSTQSLHLFTMQPGGAVSDLPISFFSYVCGNQECSGTQLFNSSVGRPIPDGQGGYLAPWAVTTSVGNSCTVVSQAWDSTSGATYVLSSVLTSCDEYSPPAPTAVLGENGNAFLSDGINVTNFNVLSGAVNWTYQGPPQTTTSLVGATMDGGISINNTQLGIVQIDVNGNASTITAAFAPNAPSYSWTGSWRVLNGVSGIVGIAPPEVADFGNVWATPGGNPSQNGDAIALCPCFTQSTPSTTSRLGPVRGQFRPLLARRSLAIPMFKAVNYASLDYHFSPVDFAHSGAWRRASQAGGGNTTYVILVGDPGINTADCIVTNQGCHNVGQLFSLAASTKAQALISASQNNTVIPPVRISSVDDFEYALTVNTNISGGVYYFGHAAQQPQSNGTYLSILAPGQGQGTRTNVSALDVSTLTSNNLGQNATITLYGCNAGLPPVEGPGHSIAQLIANQLGRNVFAWKVGLFFSATPTATLPKYKDPTKDPRYNGNIYMLPAGGSLPCLFQPNQPEPQNCGGQ